MTTHTNESRPVLMAVDGNSLLHRAYHALAGTNLRDRWGRPTWAVKGMLNLICAAAERVDADALVVGFDSSGDSVRRDRYPDYKGTRSDKHEDLVAQLAMAPGMLAYAGLAVRTVPGLEADDVTATAAKVAAEHGWHAVIVTSDRDAFGHIGEHCSVLRIINGGVENSPLLTPDRLVAMYGIRGDQYLDYAALRGDTSDNLPGVRGIGEKTAAKLLAEFGSMTAVWADVADGGARVAATCGKAVVTKLTADGARAAYDRNIDIMSAVTDLDLGIDLAGRTGEGILPAPAEKLTEACAVVNIDPRRLVSTLGTVRSAGPDPAWQHPPTEPVLVRDGEYPPDPADDREQRPAADEPGLHPAALIEMF